MEERLKGEKPTEYASSALKVALVCSVLSSCDYQLFLPSLFMYLIYLSAVWLESGFAV